ncbi:MAG: hypothetical protein ACE5JL_09480 [Dehalococcoidia bacterium]
MVPLGSGVVIIEAVIGPKGGVAQSLDSSVVITFPPGAVTSDVLLLVTRWDKNQQGVPSAPEGFLAGETLLYIEVTTLDGHSVGTFLKEIELCVRYSQGDLEVAGEDASLLVLGRYDIEDARWEILEPKLDIDTGAICVSTLRLSIWSVFAKLPAPTTGAGIGLWWIPIGLGLFFIGLLGLAAPVWGPRTYGGAVQKFRKPRKPRPEATLPETAIGERVQTVRAHLRRARLRMQQIRWRLESRQRWDTDMPRDIVAAMDAAIEEIKGCSKPTRLRLSALLQTTASEVEIALEQVLNQALAVAPVLFTSEMFEAIRACRVARFVACISTEDLAFLEEAPSPLKFSGRRTIEVTFSGRIRHTYARHFVVAGIEVVLPAGATNAVCLSPGVSVRVEGVLGPGATVFATTLHELLDNWLSGHRTTI